MATATKTAEPKRSLFDIDWKLGPLLHLVRPDLHLRLAQRFQLRGTEDRGLAVGAGVDHCIAARSTFPFLTLERRLSGLRRLVVTNELALGKRPRRDATAFFGQTWTVCDVKDRWRFERLYVRTEVQAGVNLLGLSPHATLVLDEWSIKPLWHPAALAAGALAYAGLFKYRVPLPLSLTAVKLPVGERLLKVGVQTETRRIESNPVTTLGIQSFLLTMTL